MRKLKLNRQAFIDWIYIIFGTFLTGFGISVFMNPARLAPGGVSGLGTIIYHVIEDKIIVPSTNKSAFPMPRGVYLARIWAIISVPPVLLPVLITSPMPIPFVRPVKSVQSHREDSFE